MASRFLENITFGVMAALAALFVEKPDVVYSNTWPIFATVLLTLVTRIRRIPMVVSVQDVYPESLISQHRIPADGWLASLLRTIDRFIASQASALIVISESFAHIYQNDRRVSAQRIVIVPNWLESTVVVPDVLEGQTIRSRLGVPNDACLAVYGGNIGVGRGC